MRMIFPAAAVCAISCGSTTAAQVSTPNQQGGAPSGHATVRAGVTSSVSVTNFPATQPVSAAWLPLPTGAALDMSLQTIRTTLGSPLQAGGTVVLGAGPAAIGSVSVSNLPVTQMVSGAVSVANFPSTQPVSGSVSVGPPSQQVPAGETAAYVPANTSTLVWAASAAARVLRIIPDNTTCTMRSDGGTASATSTPIPGGYVFNLIEPPPAANVSLYCRSPANVAVAQGN